MNFFVAQRPNQAGCLDGGAPTVSTGTPSSAAIESCSDWKQGLYSSPAMNSQKHEVHTAHSKQGRRRNAKVVRHRLRSCFGQLRRLKLEAVKQKEITTAMSVKMLAEAEVRALKMAATAQLGAAATFQEVDSAKGTSGLHDHWQRTICIQDTLLMALQRSKHAEEALTAAFTCPISQDIIKRPVFAPDGQVYEGRMIREWLHRKSTSPLTGEPMRCSELKRVRALEQATEALWLLRGPEGPVDEDEVLESDELEAHELQDTPSQESALLEAVRARDEARALELLQQAEVAEELNEQVREEGPEDGATALHYALLNQMPRVAKAIVMHPDFAMPRAKMGTREQVTALHIAAALGLLDVCKALLEEFGRGVLADKVKRSAILDLADGSELYLQRNEDAVNLAELHGQSELVKFLDDALEDAMAEIRAARGHQSE